VLTITLKPRAGAIHKKRNPRNYIETVWGRGYALREPDQQRP